MKRYIGLDVHKEFTFCCEMSPEGRVLRELRFPSTPEGIASYAAALGQQDRVALEATTNSLAFAKILRGNAGKVVISSPMQTKAIAWARIKTDKVDAKVPAQLLRTDYLPEVWEPDEETQHLRRRIAHREALTRTRTQVKNRIHSILHRNLVSISGGTDLFGRKGMAQLLAVCDNLPENESRQLKMELGMLQKVELQILATQKYLAEETISDSRVRLVMTLPGVGHTVAVSLAGAIRPIGRLPSAKKLVSHFGLNPRVSQTSSHCYTGPISKRGRSNARWCLVEASQIAVRSPGPLQAFFQRTMKKNGRNVAIVAVAKKMTCIIWQMLRSGTPYNWASPLLTHEKIRKIEIPAGSAKMKSGTQKGMATKGGRSSYEARRRSDYDLAQIAQTQYEEMVRTFQKKRPEAKTGSIAS
jgi:transposase